MCPSHFLSTRLQVRPLDAFLQLIALKMRIYVSMCLLVVSMMNNHIRGPKSPKTPILWAWIGISSHAKNSNSYIFRSVYQIDMKFDRQLRPEQRLRGWSRMVVKQFQDGGQPPFWKSIYRHISAKNHPILMKFCVQQQILNWMNVMWSKMKKLHWTESEFNRTYFLLVQRIAT